MSMKDPSRKRLKTADSATRKTAISRRTILKTFLAGAVTTLFREPVNQAQAHDFSGYATNRGVLVDLTRCIGCRSCERACSREHNLPAPPVDDYFDILEGYPETAPRRTDHTAFTVVNRYSSKQSDHPLFRKIQCNHCLEPACLTACFVNAYTKTPEGAVTYNPDVCVGCRTCMVACPFSIPAFKYDSAFGAQIMKCNFCFDTRLSKNRLPACVEACPMEALTFGRRNDLLRVARKRIGENPNHYQNYIYGENEAGGTSWLYLSPVPFEQAGFDMDVPKQPILQYVKDFLAVVPMVLTIWPGLFAGFYLLNRQQNKETEKHDEEA
ncbi:MAG: 4Fe-4S dicluster domain-containing protein [Desulfofustis sp.]